MSESKYQQKIKLLGDKMNKKISRKYNALLKRIFNNDVYYTSFVLWSMDKKLDKIKNKANKYVFLVKWCREEANIPVEFKKYDLRKRSIKVDYECKAYPKFLKIRIEKHKNSIH